MLSTVLFTAVLAACLLCVWIAHGEADKARAAVHEVRALKGAIMANTASIESLLTQHQKLRGSFYAFKAAVEDGLSAAE